MVIGLAGDQHPFPFGTKSEHDSTGCCIDDCANAHDDAKAKITLSWFVKYTIATMVL
jgi:hypothetical protein